MAKNPETEIANAIIKHVEKKYPQYWIKKNVVARVKMFSSFYCQVGLGVGSADLALCVNGRSVFLEVKTDTGKLDEAQVEWGKMIRTKGAVYEVVRSRDEVDALFKALVDGTYKESLL